MFFLPAGSRFVVALSLPAIPKMGANTIFTMQIGMQEIDGQALMCLKAESWGELEVYRPSTLDGWDELEDEPRYLPELPVQIVPADLDIVFEGSADPAEETYRSGDEESGPTTIFAAIFNKGADFARRGWITLFAESGYQIVLVGHDLTIFIDTIVWGDGILFAFPTINPELKYLLWHPDAQEPEEISLVDE